MHVWEPAGGIGEEQAPFPSLLEANTILKGPQFIMTTLKMALASRLQPCHLGTRGGSLLSFPMQQRFQEEVYVKRRILHVGPKGWEAKQRLSQGAGLEEAGGSVPGLSLPGLTLSLRHPCAI